MQQSQIVEDLVDFGVWAPVATHLANEFSERAIRRQMKLAKRSSNRACRVNRLIKGLTIGRPKRKR